MSVGLKAPLTVTGVVTFSEAASSPAGTVITGNMQLLGPSTPATTSQQVPINEVWHIVDVYSNGVVSGGADGMITININGIPQPVGFVVSQINTSLLTRFKLSESIPIAPGSTISMQLTLSGASGSSAVTQTVYVTIKRIPVA